MFIQFPATDAGHTVALDTPHFRSFPQTRNYLAYCGRHRGSCSCRFTCINELLKNGVGESCRGWTSSSIEPVLYIPYYCLPWRPLSIMSFISGISDDTVSFDEIAVLFKYLSPKVSFLCPRHNNQAVISYQYSTLGQTYRRKCVHHEYRRPKYMAIIRIL